MKIYLLRRLILDKLIFKGWVVLMTMVIILKNYDCEFLLICNLLYSVFYSEISLKNIMQQSQFPFIQLFLKPRC